MPKQAREMQYTIRGVPAEVDRVLRQKATKRKQSLNQVILDELALATVGPAKKETFTDLVGEWTPDPGFDEIIAAQRRIDRQKWK